MTAEWPLRPGIARGSGFVFDDVGFYVGVEVQVHSEHISGSVVGAADGCELDVALVLALGPVNDVVLPVNADI